jgi:hypothetical protein
MRLQTALLAAAGIALAGCSTTASLSGDPLAARWVGTEAGKFFAAYGPPTSDEESGSTTVYKWRGGYKTVRVPAVYKGEGKNKKLISRARNQYMVCDVKLVVGEDYMIKSITRIVDKPGVDGGPTWCLRRGHILIPHQPYSSSKKFS